MAYTTVFLLSILAVFAVVSVPGEGLDDISLGKCVDNKKDLNYFRMDMFEGKWYENATLNRLPYTAGKCGSVEYTINLTMDYLAVKESEVVDDKEIEYNSILYKINLIEYYRYNQIYSNTDHLPYKPNLRLLFKLLGTDYSCWAVVYTCIGEASIHKEIVSVLLRTRRSTCLNETTNAAVETLVKDVLSKDFSTEFSFNNHTGCKHEEPPAEEEKGEGTNEKEMKKGGTDEKEKQKEEAGGKAGEKEAKTEEKKEKEKQAGGEKTPETENKAEKEKAGGTAEGKEKAGGTAERKEKAGGTAEGKEKAGGTAEGKEKETPAAGENTGEKEQTGEHTKKEKKAKATEAEKETKE